MIKSKEQIEGIRKSCQLAAATLTFLDQYVVPGISTEKLNILADDYIRGAGAIPAPLGYKGYPKSVCISVNEVVCHGIPSHKEILKEGDILNIDVTTILDRYYGDTSKMYCAGQVSPEALQLIHVTKECMHKGIEQVKPDASLGEIGKAISFHAHSYGYSVVHQFCGHGVGVEFHEEPMIFHDNGSYDKSKMVEGMIFTIEPMINQKSPQAIIMEDNWTAKTIDNKLSAQFEHTILVTESGHEILT